MDIKNSNDPMLFFSEDNVYRQKLIDFQKVFGKSETTLVVINSSEANVSEELIKAERELTEILQDETNDFHLNDVVAIGSITSTLPEIGHPVEYTSIDDVQSLAREHPALKGYFFNDDQSATVLILKMDQQDKGDAALSAAFHDQLDLMAYMEEQHPELEFSIVGGVTTFEALREAFANDQRYLYPATLLVNFIVLLFAFGNIRVTLSVLVVAMSAVIMTQGIAGWSGYTFAAGAASSFSIVLTLTVASLIHVVHAMGQRQRRLPFQRAETIILSSFRKLTVPVMLAHITTAVGFLSLNWADAPAFKAMGNLVAIGLVFSLLLSLFVAPIALKSKRLELKIRDDRIRAISLWMSLFWQKYPVRCAAVVATLSFIALLGLVRIQFDDQVARNFPDDHYLNVNIDKINNAMGWSHSVDLVFKYDDGALTTSETYARTVELVDSLKELPMVTGVRSPHDLVLDCLAGRVPPYEGALNEVPPKMMNYCVRSVGAAFFNEDFTMMRVGLLLPRMSAADVRNLDDIVAMHVQKAGFTSEQAHITGVSVMSAYLSEVNTLHMLEGSALAMLVVSILIGFFLRSTILAMLSVLPNFLPAMASLGIWVWISTEVGMAASIIAAVTFGIVVDDTIHILYALARGKNTKTRSGIQTVLRNVTPGVLTTTMALGLGFSILMLSGFEVNRQLGFLTSITILIAFLFDVFVLPTIYRYLIGRKR